MIEGNVGGIRYEIDDAIAERLKLQNIDADAEMQSALVQYNKTLKETHNESTSSTQ